MDGDDGLSVGQQNPARDRAMQQEAEDEQAVEGGFGADPFATPAEQRGEAPDHSPLDHSPDDSTPDPQEGDPGYHPGQADQPDREESSGLTGTGPSQP